MDIKENRNQKITVGLNVTNSQDRYGSWIYRAKPKENKIEPETGNIFFNQINIDYPNTRILLKTLSFTLDPIQSQSQNNKLFDIKVQLPIYTYILDVNKKDKHVVCTPIPKDNQNPKKLTKIGSLEPNKTWVIKNEESFCLGEFTNLDLTVERIINESNLKVFESGLIEMGKYTKFFRFYCTNFQSFLKYAEMKQKLTPENKNDYYPYHFKFQDWNVYLPWDIFQYFIKFINDLRLNKLYYLDLNNIKISLFYKTPQKLPEVDYKIKVNIRFFFMVTNEKKVKEDNAYTFKLS